MAMNGTPRVGLVGWRGMVGSVLMDRMAAEGDFALIEPVFFSTSNAGGKAPMGDEPLADAFDLQALKSCDIVLTCQGGDYTSEVFAKLRAGGWDGHWIDAASTLRMEKDALIVLDPVNRPVINDAMADNRPLRNLIGKYIDRKLLDAIAAEYAKGRILLVGTTDLDARQGIIWNMTKIATIQDPRALELFQTLLVASAAIPGAFPPVLIDVEANGQPYQEMHVDGGATAQVFVYPPSLNIKDSLRKNGVVRERRAYVIRNSRLDPDWAQVERRAMNIAGRAISSLIQTQGLGDLYRIYLTTQRDGVDFNLAYIPASFTAPHQEEFDTEFMRQLYALGYDMAAKGYPWQKAPPGFIAASASK